MAHDSYTQLEVTARSLPLLMLEVVALLWKGDEVGENGAGEQSHDVVEELDEAGPDVAIHHRLVWARLDLLKWQLELHVLGQIPFLV